MLELHNVHVFYGSSHILQGISMGIKKNEVVSLLGRNGAGKTTTLRTIMGLVKPKSGSIQLMGKEIGGRSSYSISHMRVGFVYEDRRIFPRLTVRENLEVAKKSSIEEDVRTLKNIYDMFPVLEERENQLGQSLSGGEQQMLAIARTLIGNPKLLLIDEPMEGLAPLIILSLQEGIRRLREQGLTILLSEQNVWAALEVSDRCYVLDKGLVFFDGSVSDLKQQDEILDTYLGVKFAGHI